MKKRLTNILVLSIIAGLAVWLFLYDKAARPGNLSIAHEDITECETCHIPWHGVRNEMCLHCHEFSDVSDLDPRILFHIAEKHCLECHYEHSGPQADITKVDHTLFNGRLLCTQCHLDKHEGLFGDNCRECHGISTWGIKGYHHPAADGKNCNRCHRPPQAHSDAAYWTRIEKKYLTGAGIKETISVSPQECWRCHIIHDWSHLR